MEWNFWILLLLGTEIWSVAFVVASILIFFRADRKQVLEDTTRVVSDKNIFLFICGIIALWISLPISIPFSIKNIINNL